LHTRIESVLGLLLFTTGLFVGLGLAAAITWANYEASLFDVGLPAEAQVEALRCPALLTTGEEGQVTAVFRNPTEGPVRRTIRASISDGFISLPRHVETRLLLEAGQREEVTWAITPEDAVWDRLILVRIYALRSFPLPSITGTCGTLFVDLPGIRGWQLTLLLVVATVLCLGVGGWLTRRAPSQGQIRNFRQPVIVLATLTLLGLGTALAGWWLVTGVILIVSILLSMVLFTWRFTPQ
jgi:hypothetical protein